MDYTIFLQNGIIAKITAMLSILIILITIAPLLFCNQNVNVIIPVLSAIASGSMMFLYVKKDKSQ